MKEILRRQNSLLFLTKFFPASLLDVSAAYCQTVPVGESGMIRIQMGKAQYIRKSLQCMGRLVRYHPVTETVSIENNVL
jgi:hypothetical protein